MLSILYCNYDIPCYTPLLHTSTCQNKCDLNNNWDLSYILSNSIDVCENELEIMHKLGKARKQWNASVTMTITSPAPFILIRNI